jgi:(S)-citramalyl-CoA lyase
LDNIVDGIKPAALLFGAADMAADLGAETAWEPLLWVRSRIIQAAVTDIPVFDSPYFDIADVNGLKRETEASARLGFHGKCAIHPAQIAIINEVLTPTAEEVAKARQVLVVNRQSVGSVDGKMVDEAIARKARLILERAGIAAEDQFFRRVQNEKQIIKRRSHGEDTVSIPGTRAEALPRNIRPLLRRL